MRPSIQRALGGLVLGALCATCGFGIDPNKGKFTCDVDADCGSGYECRPQATRPRGLCFPVGQCKPEVCDGVDNDCDGVIDNGFDLTRDNANCGACGRSCPSGTTCLASVCHETNCGDGLDNDNNGLTDCADPFCRSLSCSPDGGLNCGSFLAPPDAGTDAGIDAGVPDGGLPDAGLADGGGADAGALDGGLADAGVDAGPLDAGNPDGGVDAGTDAGTLDGGGDAGVPDAGVDAGAADAGLTRVLACVPRETVCFDGVDNDGDGLIDCADPDCRGQVCGLGKICTPAGTCQ